MIDLLNKILQNEYAVIIIASIFGSIWTAFKASEFYRERLRFRDKVVYNMVAGSVTDTYYKYVEKVKELDQDNEKGLTLEQKQKARELTNNTIRREAKKKNINIDKHYSDKEINAMIEENVHKNKIKIKRRGGRVIRVGNNG